MQEGSWVIHLFSKVSFESTKKDIVSAKEVVDDRDSSNSSWVSSAVHNCQKFCLAQVLPKKIYVLRKGKPAYSKTINLLDYFQTVQVQRLALKSKNSASPKGSRQKKPGYFTVRLTVRGGGVNPPWLDRSICEKFNTFFLWNMIP